MNQKLWLKKYITCRSHMVLGNSILLYAVLFYSVLFCSIPFRSSLHSYLIQDDQFIQLHRSFLPTTAAASHLGRGVFGRVWRPSTSPWAPPGPPALGPARSPLCPGRACPPRVYGTARYWSRHLRWREDDEEYTWEVEIRINGYGSQMVGRF